MPNYLDFSVYVLVTDELATTISALQMAQQLPATVSNLGGLVAVITDVVLSNDRQGTTRTSSSPKCSKFGLCDRM